MRGPLKIKCPPVGTEATRFKPLHRKTGLFTLAPIISGDPVELPCVKISRALREIHASQEGLRAKSLSFLEKSTWHRLCKSTIGIENIAVVTQ